MFESYDKKNSHQHWLTPSTVITLVRIALIPFIVWSMVYGFWWQSLVLFCIACISDALDGALARWYGQETVIGAFLDTAADKILFLSSVVVLAFLPESPYPIPGWFIIFFMVREAAVSLGGILLFMMRQGLPIKPVAVSKCAGFVRSLFVTLMLLAYFIPVVPLWALSITFYCTVVLELLACAQYAWMLMCWVLKFA